MTMISSDEFSRRREEYNRIVMKYANQGTKRFYNLDTAVYREGALDAKTKELLGLVSSMVLRCDDCVTYHLIRCHDEGVTSEELVDALNVGLVVGGSITIPHLRRALKQWDELVEGGEEK